MDLIYYIQGYFYGLFEGIMNAGVIAHFYAEVAEEEKTFLHDSNMDELWKKVDDKVMDCE